MTKRDKQDTPPPADARAAKKARRKKLLQLLWIPVLLLLVSLAGLYLQHTGNLTVLESPEAFRAFIAGFGVWAPIIFFIFQVVQVLIAFIPGMITCMAGALMFGFWEGFLLNYTAICLGSVMAFMLGRKFGMPVIEMFVSSEHIQKYKHYLNHKYFKRLFIIAIVIPGMPDDSLSFLAGLSDMTLKEIIWTMILGKPWVLLLYSLVGNGVIHIPWASFGLGG